MLWTIIPIVTVLGMIGGQTAKWTRRYLLSSVSILYGSKKSKKVYWLGLLALVLSMGYGKNSKLNKLLGGRDWLVRMVYGAMIGGIVGLAGFVWSVIVMPLAFLFRCNWSFKVGKFDWLWEDFVRYSALGFCIWRVIA